MDLRRLHYFVVLAETLHFGRAALRLNMSQPPLSHQIHVLEEELQARLFERNNRRVELTPAGQALLPEARALLEQAQRTGNVAARVQRGELGQIRVGFTSAAALAPVIPDLILAYRQRWPGVQVRIEELSTQEQLQAILAKRLDFAFVRGTDTPELPPSLGSIRLFEDALVAALPASHPHANSTRALAVSALVDDRFVMYPRESGIGAYQQAMALCHHAGFAPQITQEARSAATIVGLVAAGLGVALVPESFRSIQAKGVVFRPLKDKDSKSAMWLVFNTGKVSVQEQGFMDLAGVPRSPIP
ncbi:LysR family transcriptional regulator [Comamonas testosteroni]|uniref:LysR family transcriptional regulator n=1 Tax=Comamonas testosteroni TaxID=285 RepID=A0A373FN95_COMTE|nr:LysR substrate-binding domain-containing protein [Comamonas testosteroni]RGE45387.1 LysR family transcriptional regulator [Comamonas testosteroni]